MNYKRLIPNLVAWTSKPGEDYTELSELYEESVSRWFGNMNHVATIIGGVEVDLKTSEQSGAVYRVVPKARQEAALTHPNPIAQVPLCMGGMAALTGAGC